MAEEFRGCGCPAEIIAPVAQNFDSGDYRDANIRIVDGLEAFDYSWMTCVEVSDRVGVEQVHSGLGLGAPACSIDVCP